MTTPGDTPFEVVLAAIRGGVLPPGSPLDDASVTRLLDVPRASVPHVRARLQSIGLAEGDSGAAGTVLTGAGSSTDPSSPVVVASPDIDAWTDASRLTDALFEVAVRTVTPTLSDGDVRTFDGLVARARDSAARRDPAFRADLDATVRFWVDRTADALLREGTRNAMDRVRFGLNPTPQLELWDFEPWFRIASDAAARRDVVLAMEAAHVLAGLAEQHVTAVRRTFHAPPDRPAVRSGPLRVADSWPVDSPAFALLAALRSRELHAGTTTDVKALAARFGTTAATMRTAVRRVEVIGLATLEDADVVRLLAPTVAEWADAQRLFLGLHEACTRWAVPHLTGDDRRTFSELIDRLRREASLQAVEYGTTLVQLTRFFLERTPNPLLARSTAETIARVAFLLTPTPPFRQWRMGDYLAELDEAVRTGDPEQAAAAAHAAIRYNEAHIATEGPRYASMDS